MLDLEVEPYLLASSLLGVLAQRLVRKICPDCRRPYEPTSADWLRWNLPEDQRPAGPMFKGKGCPACLGTGYHGRLGIFELLMITEPIREQVLHRGRSSSIKALGLAGGMKTLYASGLEKVAQGLTPMDEVVRVTSRDEF